MREPARVCYSAHVVFATSKEKKDETVRARSIPFVAALSMLIACGGGRPPEAASGAPSNDPLDGGATEPASDDAGGEVAEERPFARSTAEATGLIASAVDKKQDEIIACVRAFRERKKLAREKVAVSFGIGQEGKLLGVTSKGKEDTELKSCVHEALKSATFPRSHAGVITVTKTYEEILQ